MYLIAAHEARRRMMMQVSLAAIIDSSTVQVVNPRQIIHE
jgi:hypothetical protein